MKTIGARRGAGPVVVAGGGIRTPDLWVMSPTSCHCSTPRRQRRRRRGSGGAATASPPTGSPPQYSPALRWVTTGFGMGPGGATALSATAPPDPRWIRRHLPPALLLLRPRPRHGVPPVTARPHHDRDSPGCPARISHPRPLGRVGSGRLPAVHLPPSNPVVCRGSSLVSPMGRLVWRRSSRLDAFSG